jgi:hypothetical protein
MDAVMNGLRILVAAALAVRLATAGLGGQEFTSLFNGTSLAGWVEMGEKNSWVAADGTLTLKNPRNYPNWLRSDKEYENFVLKIDYRMTGWCETGIFIHAPLYGDLTKSGIRLHLRHDRTAEGSRSTGGIYDVVPPMTMANKGTGEWNRLEIRVDWPVLQVKMNDTTIQNLNMEHSEELRDRLRRGYIGLDDLNCGGISYRNIQIQELPDKDRKWTSLFNGRDLSGWTSQGVARWNVKDGIVSGSGGDGFLFTDQEFRAFEFTVYFRTSPHANGGIYFRRTASFRGYEIQIYNQRGATNPTGSVYGRVGATSVPCRDGDWCQMRIISDGALVKVWVNGFKVAEGFDLPQDDVGSVGFQNHSQHTIEYLAPMIRSVR